ncbi:DASH complex subunit Dad3 [Phaffia rhodozyma]|uniref:DASH complex subunit DAD3 n=1 Tax=Phaffia rhodozyma TaxID=264483 RepID=A0A0F7SQY6_PHARH|nr:DASH complex subunit Dad3 [Phaffia rhodozyma]
MSSSDNPYSLNSAFSPLEASVLLEYAKLSQQLKKIASFKRQSNPPHEEVLLAFRGLEKKMGLVLTLFKSSVWAVTMDQEEEFAQEASLVNNSAQLQPDQYPVAYPQRYDENAEDSLDDADITIQDQHQRGQQGWR